MAELTLYPMTDDFDTTLAQEWDGATGTVYLNAVPDITIPSGDTTIITVNPGKSNMQAAIIDSIDTANKTVNVSSITVNKGAGTAYTQQTHSIGSIVKISNNYEYFETIKDTLDGKMELTGGEGASFDYTVSGSNFRIRKDGSDMKFRDDNQAETSLSQLASLSGVNDKFKISADDTTENYAINKITGGDGITVTETNGGSNETLDIDIDTSDGTIFTVTQSANKVAMTNGDGNVNDLIDKSYIPAGSFIFGGGSDGDVTISTNTTLTRDMYYNDLTINPSITLYPDGYKIYVNGTLTNNGTISRNGNNGSNGSGATGGAGGTALNAGTLDDSISGGAGGNGGTGGSGDGNDGTAGTNSTTSYSNVNGSAGGNAGDANSGIGNPGSGGAGGTTTRGSDYNTVLSLGRLLGILLNPASCDIDDLTTLVGSTRYKGPASSGGGGGGSSNIGGTGGGGGGGGTAGGTVRISARTLNNAGIIESIGGNGGNGANASVAGGGGGGGGGGAGGVVYLIYKTLTDIGTVTVTGGTAGIGGNGASGTNGSAGTAGSTGVSIQVQVSD